MSPYPYDLPSVAVFSSQSKAAEDGYLRNIRAFLCQSQDLFPLKQSLKNLPSIWSFLSTRDPDLAALSHAPPSLQALSDWISTGNSTKISTSSFGIIALPLLTIIQLIQYYQFLRAGKITHVDFIAATRNGAGIQGYCSGLLPSAVVACSANEVELVSNACKAVRLAVGLGAYGDLGARGVPAGPTMMAIRSKYDGQAEEVVESFPEVHISAITDPKIVTAVGPPAAIKELDSHAVQRGLRTLPVLLAGKLHDPDNHPTASRLIAICESTDCMRLPDASSLQVSMRSNTTAKVLTEGSLTAEVVSTILTSQCRWHEVLAAVATDLQSTGQRSHSVVQFGIGDCVPTSTFNEAEVGIRKFNAISLPNTSTPPTVDVGSGYLYPEDAVAITSMACRTAGANTVEEFWELISSGRSMVQEVPRERINIPGSFRTGQDKWAQRRKFYGNFVSDVDVFDSTFFHVNPREAIAMDPQQRLLLETAYQAVESSGYLATHRRDSGDRVGVFIGASYIDYIEHVAAYGPTAYTAPGTIRAFLCGKISHYFGWLGPSEVFDTACSASGVAITRACRALQSGECSMALAGGVNLMSTPTNFLDLGKAGFLSPSGQCKPFESNADGYCRGEGVGLIMLKRLSQAQFDGDRILGVIPGTATNQGGLSSSITVPHHLSQIALFRDILRQANMSPEKVSYVEAHGPGTQAGDPIEIASIRDVFGGSSRLDTVHIGSVKANIGHCEPGAGILGVIKALLMIEKGIIPPLANFSTLNPKIPPLKPDKMQSLLEKSPGMRTSRQSASTAMELQAATLLFFFPLVLSASSKQSLLSYFQALRKHLTTLTSGDIGDLAFSLAEKRGRHRFLWTSTTTKSDFLLESLASGSENVIEIPQKPRSVVLVFSGQTSKFIGLDKGLFDSCDLLRMHLNECDQGATSLGISGLLSAIFATQPLDDVVLLQCGMFAVQYACASSWISSGLKVNALIGHSFGELTALVVSGILELKDALIIVASRARFMVTKWGSERGTMLAINGKAGVVSDLIAKLPQAYRDVEIACYNALTSHVIVGAEKSIMEVERLLETKPEYAGISNRRLDVSHGFHSRFTDGFLNEMDNVASSVRFNPPKIYLETCTPQRIDDISSTRISQHKREPVYFHQAVRRIEERLGPCIWLEAGIDSPIIPMVKRAVNSPKAHVFQALQYANRPDPLSPISKVTEKLWREGITVSYWSFHKSQHHTFKHMWLPPYQFEKARYWLPYVDRAVEVQQSQSPPSLREAGRKLHKSSKLLVCQDEDEPCLFAINTLTNHFSDIVSGHSVSGRPLCPASMYMECAAMAAQVLNGSIDGKELWFECLSFEAPLSLNPSREVSLEMRADEGGDGWSYKVKSSYRADQNAKSTVHSKGRLGFSNVSTSSKEAWIKSYQRLVTCRTKAVSESLDIESFRSQRAYTLFSRVVNYSEILRRISFINIAGSEAIAEVHTVAQIHNKESTVTQMCDTVTLDNFIQVAGLLVNTGDDLSLDDAFIASGIEMVSISVSCDFSKEGSWKVYTMITQHSFSKVTADVFVVNTNGSLVVAIIGVNFSRLPLRQIGLSLERVNQTLSGGTDSMGSPKITSTTFESDTSTRVTTPDYPTKPKVVKHERDGSAAQLQESQASKEAWPQRREDLTTLIAEIMGIEQSAVNDNVSLECLGFDSLSLMELKSDIEGRIPFQLENDFDAKTTVSALQDLLVSDARWQDRSHAEHHQAASTPSPLRPQNTAHYQKQKSEHLSPASPGIRQSHDLVTIPYKTVNDLEILADVYFPKQPTHSKPMAIALMIHGGGFMTMSRTAIRPWQTSHLLEHNVVPVSIDHRLCPEINIIEGPMADVRDALKWVRNELPIIASKHNISLDSQRVAVIGWSTGGHLAMTTAWTTIEANLEPPQAILNFYGPSDFQSEVWKTPRAIGYPERTMTMQEIRAHLSPKPISTHHIPNSESQFAGLCPGDARSELVLETLKADNFVSILLCGMPADEDQDLQPTPDEIAAISPLAQVRKGIYKTPTCIVHGSEDEVVPCRMSQAFGEALASSGVTSEVVVVSGAKHMHDLFLKPGKPGWEDGVASAYGFLFEHLFV